MRKSNLASAAVIVLAAIAAGTAFGGGAAEVATEEKPTLIWLAGVQGGREPEENPLFEAEVERLSGLKVKLVKVPGSEHNTKMTAMLATGEPLDIIYIGASQFEALWEQRLFEPLTDRIEASAVLSDPEIIPASEWDRIRREDGEIYGVFNKFEQGTLPTIRMDWLEKLDLPVPETFDDYYDVLRAFTFDDPDGNGKDDTWGLSIGYTLYDLAGLFGAYGLQRGIVVNPDGSREVPYATEAAMPVYEWLTKLYAEGILEPGFITNKSSNFRDLFMTDKAGMTFYWAAWVGLFNQQVKTQNPNSPFKARGIAPPRGPAGRRLRAGDDGLMVNPGTSQHHGPAFQVMEFWHTYEGNVLSTLGIEGHDYTVSNGKYTLTEVGKAHAMDHGAPQPKSLKWVNPLGELEGFEEAAAIVREYGLPQMPSEFNSQFENICRSEAARIILGEISAAQGVANMRARLREEGVIK
jgi:putative aldouronate transport system substrate-binding protein